MPVLDIFDRVREKNKAIALIVKLQNTALYPAVFAIICLISSTHGKAVYLPCAWLLTATVIFSLLFASDLKVALVPFFMVYYAIGMDVSKDFWHIYSGQAVPPPFDSSSLWQFIPCVLLMFSALIYKLVSRKLFGEMFKKRSSMLWGLLAVSAVLPLGGIFTNEFTFKSFAFGAILGISIIATYIIFTVIFRHANDGIAYACKVLMALGFCMCAQVAVIAFYIHRQDSLFLDGKLYYSGIHNRLSLSWGLTTIIGAILVVCIIAALYLMRNRKYPLFSLFSVALFMCVIVFISARTAMLVAVLAIAVGIIASATGGVNKKTNLIAALSVASAIILGIIILIVGYPDSYKSIINKIAANFRFGFIFKDISNFQQYINEALSNRPLLWDRAVKDFAEAPVFGKGFEFGYYFPTAEENLANKIPALNVLPQSNLFSNMYHNIILQILGSLGLAGLAAFGFHTVQLVKRFFKGFTAEKLIIMLIPLCILAMSMADNFFFQPNFMIFYTAFLAAAEFLGSQKREKENSVLENS